MRLLGSVLAVCAFGWALVVSAESRQETPSTIVVTRVERLEALPERLEALPETVVPTPIADAAVDWEQVERDEQCLWELLQMHEVEITFEIVWAAGVWADALGGPCLMIGEDDE